MASSVSLTYAVKATVAEILDAADCPGGASAAARTLNQANYDTASRTLNGASTPPVALAAFFTKGTGTIDLAALVGVNGHAVVGTGLRVQLMRLRNSALNANPINIKIATSNGYDGFGAAFSLDVAPGAEVTILANDAGGNVGGTNKDLTVTATSDQLLDVEIVLG